MSSPGDAAAPAVLALDTAAPVVGVATWSPSRGETRAWSARAVRGADRLLAPALQDQLAWLEEAGEALGLVVVSVGPGSFTGLRVGVAGALGLAVARGLPVLPVSSLWARACLLEGPGLVLLDARKSRVYVGRFEPGADGLPVPRGPEGDLPLARALPAEPSQVVGEGARAFAEELRLAGHLPVAEPGRSPCAEVARRAWARRAEAVDAGAVALRYLRAPDARLPSAP